MWSLTSTSNVFSPKSTPKARRFRYFGDVGFDAAETASLYASVAPILTNGFEN
jgi:hypothetical protein